MTREVIRMIEMEIGRVVILEMPAIRPKRCALVEVKQGDGRLIVDQTEVGLKTHEVECTD